MDSTRIADLLHPYVENLSDDQLEQIAKYIDLLVRWNAKTNLTAIRDPEQIVTRHFGESFFLARQLFGGGHLQSLDRHITRSPDVFDLGSGAGFPGIPLKIFRPNLTITLVEAHHTKAVFLREVLRALHLDAEVKNVRAESLPDASADLVTLRAVEKFEAILPIAARLIRPGKNVMDADRPRPAGLALLIGSAQVARVQELLPNWHFHPEIPIPKSQNRVIQVIEPNW